MQVAVGVAEHGNSAELVTVGTDGQVHDRRRIDLTKGLPTHPYHHEGSWAVGRYVNSPWARPTTLEEAVSLVKQVHAAAEVGARDNLEGLAAALPAKIEGIALRICPDLPATIEETIADARAATMADSILYRQALAKAAEARGWRVLWYDPKQVFVDAATVAGREDIQAYLSELGRQVGSPWQARHKLAAAAAIVAAARFG